MSTHSRGGIGGILVYSLFLLSTVIIGPLEAVLGLALYWLFSD
ncbi:hypothetical protein [Haloferax elongans]|nr:hypothetical protein [Haloferax elongans]